MVRHLQSVSPGGLACKVNSTISAIFSWLIVGLRPRPERTAPSQRGSRMAHRPSITTNN
jgi:hypothetical protein